MKKVNELIQVKQLPIIEEKLKGLSEEIDKKVEIAISLICTEDTVKDVKKTRAELSKDFKELESKRKEVKEQVMKPYNEFDEIYKKYISDKFKNADSVLKEKIDTVETELKSQKENEVKKYFEELCVKENVNFIDYSQVNVNVTLSASMKSLKDTVKTFIDKVVDDIKLIETQENNEEIMIEYKKDLNVSRAITEVKERHIALEKAKEEKKNKKEQELTDEVMLEKIDSLTAPKEEVIEEQQEEIVAITFTVKGTRTKLKEVKEFLDSGGYDYE